MVVGLDAISSYYHQSSSYNNSQKEVEKSFFFFSGSSIVLIITTKEALRDFECDIGISLPFQHVFDFDKNK
jgi:hypothetical protein